MIRVQGLPMTDLAQIQSAVQQAILLEFSTLPPYLYALYSLRPDANGPARARIQAVVREEMVHLCLACNLLNAIGGTPTLADASLLPTYPGPLPMQIGSEPGGGVFVVGLVPFSKQAISTFAHIEEPEEPVDFPHERVVGSEGAEPAYQTIGEFYEALKKALVTLGSTVWDRSGSRQLGDQPFFAGELFPVRGYEDACTAIDRIVSEGEGSAVSPLDFEGELAHFYRFEEIRREQLLVRADTPEGYAWGDPLPVDWEAVFPAISNPALHDFSGDPAAQACQDACDRAFTRMVQELQRCCRGEEGRLGNAVREMFALRLAAVEAFTTPLVGRSEAAGPAFLYRPELT